VQRGDVSVPDRVDVAVIGGGVVGLAIARALALAGREVVVLEAESALGMHTSSRNSEVVHAGIYYAAGSLKAALCVTGKDLLYDYCEREGVPHARLGKLIAATRDEEIPELERILARARANGVHDLTWLDAAEVRSLEPEVVAVKGLLSPSTGIVDSHALMATFKRDALASGAHVVTSTPVLGGRVVNDGFLLELGGAEPTTVHVRALVNASGLRAPSVSVSIAGVDRSAIPAEHFAKGHYFVLNGRPPFRRLVYPVPVPGGLGVHVTMDLAGQARFGPDVSYIDGVDYTFDESRAAAFSTAIRRYYPALVESNLSPGYTGIRPKLGPAGTQHDFVIQAPATTGAPGFVALYGIESPGLTASLAIGERVRDLLSDARSCSRID
jgi:L-2-hydroxyglutarate oxidase LhgO